MMPLRWIGGKARALPWLLPRLPHTESYIEPFGGSAVVLLNKRPCEQEVYNDLNSDVVHFFKTLRQDGNALQSACRNTAYAREEFEQALRREEGLTDLERARRFFVLVRMCSFGLQKQFGISIKVGGSLPRAYYSASKTLAQVADRLRRVQIESGDGIELATRYDSKDVLVYCDPPYLHGTRQSCNHYAHEMTDADHEAMAKKLAWMKSKVAVSGYDSPLYTRLFKGWYRHGPFATVTTVAAVVKHGKMRQQSEYLWTNYQIMNGTRVT